MDQGNEIQSNVNGNIWDKVFKTFLQEIPQMVLPLINEVFQEDYSMDLEVLSLNNEFYNEDDSRIISDTSFQVNKKLYHFECQFSNDTEMAFRMFEYDFHIALSDAKRKNRIDEFVFPKSCVVYITTNKNNPKSLNMKIIFPNGVFLYEVPTVRVQDYSLKSISEKNLFIFLPYLVLRFQQKLKNKQRPATYVFRDYPDIIKEVDPMVANLLNLQSVEMKRAFEQQTRELEQQKKATEQATKQASLANIEMLKQFGITLTDEQIQAMLKHAVEQQKSNE